MKISEVEARNDRAIRMGWIGLCTNVASMGLFVYAALMFASGWWRGFYFVLAGVNCGAAGLSISGLLMGYRTRKLLAGAH